MQRGERRRWEMKENNRNVEQEEAENKKAKRELLICTSRYRKLA
jgi:hypothetical protein